MWIDESKTISALQVLKRHFFDQRRFFRAGLARTKRLLKGNTRARQRFPRLGPQIEVAERGKRLRALARVVAGEARFLLLRSSAAPRPFITAGDAPGLAKRCTWVGYNLIRATCKGHRLLGVAFEMARAALISP